MKFSLVSVRRPGLYLCLFALLILVVRSLQMNAADILIDDAFISFRYATNLASGHGLVFNSGERVEGYTNFLWTFLLAGIAFLGIDLIPASKALAGLAAAGTLILIYLLGGRTFAGRRDGYFLTGLAMIIFALMGSQARYVVSGMETLLFTFLLALSIYLYLYSERPLLAGLAFALLAMTRPEGLLYFGLAIAFAAWGTLAGMEVRQDRAKGLLIFLAGFVLLYSGYFLWRFGYYGYILPNTYYAKASGFNLARIWRGLELLAQLVRWWGLPILLVLSLIGFFARGANRARYLFAALIGATIFYFVYVGGDFIVWFGPRFLMPILPMLLLMTSRGVAFLTDTLTQRKSLPRGLAILAGAGIVALLVVNATWYSWPARHFYKDGFVVQMRGWAELGRWLAVNTPPETTLATDAAGLIPFYSGRYTIDMFGLTDAHIAHSQVVDATGGVVAHEKYDPHYVLERRPDCIISTWLDGQGQALAAGLPNVKERFEAEYQLAAVAKVTNGPPPDGDWVLPVSRYTPDLHSQGYITGLFCRRSH